MNKLKYTKLTPEKETGNTLHMIVIWGCIMFQKTKTLKNH